MTYDLKENIIEIYRYQSFDNSEDYGIAYQIEPMDMNEITKAITILEIIKQHLLAKFDKLGWKECE